MKKIMLFLAFFGMVFMLAACTECEECEECQECEQCEECEECEECEDCEECPDCVQNFFYVEKDYEASGYTPAYTYYLSGTLNDEGEITSIRYDMVSVVGTSKRSTDYKMNAATITVGGTSGNQTVNIFIGGSSENIAQIYNKISATATADGSELFKTNFPILGAYPGAVVAHEDEIYATLADGLGITIDDTTTLADVLTAAGLYDTDNSLVKNGDVYVELTGAYGGKNYNNQLHALETYAVDNALTLVELYELVSTNNQGYDNRDAVAGATIMFDHKLVEMTAMAAGITIDPNATSIIGNVMDGTDTVITVKAKGMYEMVAEVTIDTNGDITAIDVLSHTETDGLGKDVIDAGTLVQAIITGQDNIDGVDAVAGSTLTSNALKNIARAAIEEYSN